MATDRPRLELGYWLSSEERSPAQLVADAAAAEAAGFGAAMISDHFHPWVRSQGQSPFVWGVLGGIAEATRHLRVGTGVVAPVLRIHPAVVAHVRRRFGVPGVIVWRVGRHLRSRVPRPGGTP